MSIRIRQAFDLHLCFNEEHGNEVMAYEISHRWELPDCRKGVLDGMESLLTMESRYIRDDEDMTCIGFPIRYSQTGRKIYLGHEKQRFPYVGVASGGNQFWEVVRLPHDRVAHVFNWVRRREFKGKRMFSPSEWDAEFYEKIWCSRRPLDQKALFDFGAKLVREHLRAEAKRCEMTVPNLINACKFHEE